MAKKQTFEQALKELQTIVDQLEAGDLTLDEALTQFESGIKLSRHCTTLLDKAETKVTQLIQKADGHIEEKPYLLADDAAA